MRDRAAAASAERAAAAAAAARTPAWRIMVSGNLLRLAWLLAYTTAFSGTVLILCGLAAVQEQCNTASAALPGGSLQAALEDALSGLSGAGSGRRLLQQASLLSLLACDTLFRFQWWAWALQLTFVALVTWSWAAKYAHTGVIVLGAVPTTLCCLLANDTLLLSEGANGTAFSHSTLLFVGWILAATGNFSVMLISSLIPGLASAPTAAATDAGKAGLHGATVLTADASAA